MIFTLASKLLCCVIDGHGHTHELSFRLVRKLFSSTKEVDVLRSLDFLQCPRTNINAAFNPRFFGAWEVAAFR